MASEALYCMECVEGRAVALGLCSHCLAGEPVEAVVGQIARLARELEESRRERSAARAEALTAQASLRRVERELEEARNHARRVVVALRAICDEAAIGGPPLVRRREEWEAALSEADEVLGSDLYDDLYGDWRRVERCARAQGNRGAVDRVEVLWLNAAAARHQQPNLFDEMVVV